MKIKEITKKKKKIDTRKACNSCGTPMAGSSEILSLLNFHCKAPHQWEIADTEAKEKGRLSLDLCKLADMTFIKGLLEISIIQEGSTLKSSFSWGVWIEVSQQLFNNYIASWHKEGREKDPPIEGKFANNIPLYPNTIGMKVAIHFREPGKRPWVEVKQVDHPLYTEQKSGLTPKRAVDMAISVTVDEGARKLSE